jgi:hypothetical protein
MCLGFAESFYSVMSYFGDFWSILPLRIPPENGALEGATPFRSQKKAWTSGEKTENWESLGLLVLREWRHGMIVNRCKMM